MVSTEEQERVQDLLKKSISALCKAGLSYKTSLSIKARVVVVVDVSDTIVLSISDEVGVGITSATNPVTDHSQIPWNPSGYGYPSESGNVLQNIRWDIGSGQNIWPQTSNWEMQPTPYTSTSTVTGSWFDQTKVSSSDSTMPLQHIEEKSWQTEATSVCQPQELTVASTLSNVNVELKEKILKSESSSSKMKGHPSRSPKLSYSKFYEENEKDGDEQSQTDSNYEEELPGHNEDMNHQHQMETQMEGYSETQEDTPEPTTEQENNKTDTIEDEDQGSTEQSAIPDECIYSTDDGAVDSGHYFSGDAPDISLYKVNDLYRCPYCPFTNTHGSALKVHLSIHTRKKRNRLKCHHCGKMFIRSGSLKKHINALHLKKLPCHRCPEVFSTRKLLQTHQNLEHGSDHNSKKTKCPHCSYTSQHSGNLKRHIQSHAETKLQCDLCNKGFFDNSQLKKHMNDLHKDCKPICEICNEEFADMKTLHLHRKEVHKTGSNGKDKRGGFSCSGCEFTTAFEKSLERHTKHLDPAESKCKFCDKLFICRNEKVNHVREFHPLELKKKVCEFCSKVFMSFQGLYTHRKVVHANEIDQSERKIFYCHVCGKGFPVFMYLTRHLKSHDDSKPYQCPKCLRWFKYHRNFKTHKEGCINTSGYPCHICGKSLKTEYNLRIHCRSLHAEHRQHWSCRRCGMKFAHPQSRNKHEKVSCMSALTNVPSEVGVEDNRDNPPNEPIVYS